MDLRSDYILGKDFFLKVINIDSETSLRLKDSLEKNEYAPFDCVEFLITYLLTKKGKDLISPKTEVLSSSGNYNIDYFKNKNYNSITEDKNFVNFEKELKGNIANIQTVIIISERVEGNLDAFIRTSPINKDLEDAFIHICWLYYEYQKRFFCTHGDPKAANYTWKRLDTPIDITYNFENKNITRKGVKNIFYLTDLEFAHSPFTIKEEIQYSVGMQIKYSGGIQLKYFNFTKIYDFIDDKRKDIIFTPKLSSSPYYDYNINLYGGYEEKILKDSGSIMERYGHFPRIFSIDLLTLIKTLLTYDYPKYLTPQILRKFNLYFTRFISLTEDYNKVSPTSLAILLSE